MERVYLEEDSSFHKFQYIVAGKRKLHMQKNNQRDRGKPGQVLYYGNQSIKDFQNEEMINSINFG